MKIGKQRHSIAPSVFESEAAREFLTQDYLKRAAAHIEENSMSSRQEAIVLSPGELLSERGNGSTKTERALLPLIRVIGDTYPYAVAPLHNHTVINIELLKGDPNLPAGRFNPSIPHRDRFRYDEALAFCASSKQGTQWFVGATLERNFRRNPAEIDVSKTEMITFDQQDPNLAVPLLRFTEQSVHARPLAVDPDRIFLGLTFTFS